MERPDNLAGAEVDRESRAAVRVGVEVPTDLLNAADLFTHQYSVSPPAVGPIDGQTIGGVAGPGRDT